MEGSQFKGGTSYCAREEENDIQNEDAWGEINSEFGEFIREKAAQVDINTL